MPVGSDLREAREAAGLLAEQVGERTKIQPHKIEALENDQFDRLPHGIHLDVIIRAYAREVGIEADPLIKRARVERARFVAKPGAPPDALDMFLREDEHTREVSAPAVSAPTVSPPAPPPTRVTRILDDIPAVVPRHPLAVEPRPVTPPAQQTTPAPRPRRPRPFELVVMTMLVLASWALFFWMANRPGRSEIAATADSISPRPEPPAEDGSASRIVEPQPPSSDAGPGVAGRETSNVAGTMGTGRATPGDTPPPEPPNRSKETTTAATAVPGLNVSGAWALAAEFERSSEASLEGQVVGYEVQLQQAGTRISGGGRRISENGRTIDTSDQTPISLSGAIQGKRVTLTFTQGGSHRMSQGKLMLLVDGTAAMHGRFSSADAQSSGLAEARRRP